MVGAAAGHCYPQRNNWYELITPAASANKSYPPCEFSQPLQRRLYLLLGGLGSLALLNLNLVAIKS